MAGQQQKKQNMEITERFISLEKIIAQKNKHLLRIIPRFVMKSFKRLIHLDRINSIIYNYRDKWGVDFADAVLTDIGIKVETENSDLIPADNRPLIISNHPLGAIDGMALISEVGKKRKDILFPVNDILCQLPGLKGLFIPINKYGSNSENQNSLNNAFMSDNAMLFFPAGMVSRKKKGIIRDLEWKKTFIRKAVENRRDIMPVYCDAKNSNSFYRFCNWRKRLGIKFNIELIFLPKEMFSQQGKTIKLYFSKPIPYQTFDKRHSYKEWAEILKDFVYQLKENPNKEFNY